MLNSRLRMQFVLTSVFGRNFEAVIDAGARHSTFRILWLQYAIGLGSKDFELDTKYEEWKFCYLVPHCHNDLEWQLLILSLLSPRALDK